MRMASPHWHGARKARCLTPLHPRPHAALARRAGKIKPAPSSWVLLFRRRTPYNVGFYYRGGLRAVCFTALARLQDGPGESFPDSPGTRIIDVAFPLNDAFDPLLWCGQQAQWPQFYWQQRNGDEKLATLGAVKPLPRSTRRTAFTPVRPAGSAYLRPECV